MLAQGATARCALALALAVVLFPARIVSAAPGDRLAFWRNTRAALGQRSRPRTVTVGSNLVYMTIFFRATRARANPGPL
jgi:hypothetical protein